MSQADLPPIAAELVDALLAHVDRDGGLDEQMLEGSWAIGLAAGDRGEELLEEVLSRSPADQDSLLLRRIVRDLPHVGEHLQHNQGGRLLTLITEDPTEAASLLATLDEDIVGRVLPATRTALAALARPLLAKQRDEEEDAAYAQRQQSAQDLIDALGSALGKLAEHQAFTQAEALADAIIGALDIRGRDPVERHLEALSPIQSSALTASCLRVAGLRPPGRRAAWLQALDPGRAWAVEQGRAVLDVADKLWASIATQDVPAPTVAAIASELARLRGDRAWPARLSLSEVINDPAATTYDEFEARLAVIRPMVEVDLVDPAQLSAARVAAAAGELRRAHPATVDHSDVVRFVTDTLQEELVAAPHEPFGDAWQALQEEDWLPDIEENRLRLVFSVAAKRRGFEIEPIADVDAVLGYIAAHGPALDREVAGWVALDPGDDVIWQIIRSYGMRRPESLLGALTKLSGRADGKRRLALVKPALAGRPDERLLESLSFHAADQSAVAELLVERYGNANNNREREQVLLLWRALRPSEDEPRRVLINTVMISMVSLNGEALDLVLREIDLARDPPHGTKRALRDALRDGGKAHKREKQVRAKLEQLGWSRRAGRVRRRDVDVDADPDADIDID